MASGAAAAVPQTKAIAAIVNAGRVIAARLYPVALVARNGRVQLSGVLSAVNGPLRVTLADGNVAYSGYEWVMKPGTVRTAFQGRAAEILFNWGIPGQIRYFDARTFRALIIGEPGGTFPKDARSKS